MRIIPQDGGKRITVDASYPAHFARTRQRPSKLVFAQTDEELSSCECRNGTELSYSEERDGVVYTVKSFADSIYHSGTEWYLEKVFERERLTKRSRPFSDPTCVAEAVLCAHMLCCDKKLDGVHLRITLRQKNGNGEASFESYVGGAFLKNMADVLLLRAIPFIKIEVEMLLSGIPALRDMPFPYPRIREAQSEFITSAYRAMKKGERLLVCAPTGVGKTVSALYPALRAVGAEIAEKVFYLTAKTVTGNAAADAVRAMAVHAPALRCVTVLAKERVCPMMSLPKRAGASRCRFCPLMGEADRIPYEERRDAALLDLLRTNHVIDTQSICAAAKAHTICPYELSLDVSEYAQVVICDYNYVFDTSVRFKRYFIERRDGKYIFLIDEAHNLPDRAREMYSAELDTAAFLKLYKCEDEPVRKNGNLCEAVKSVIKEMKKTADLCRDEEREMPGGVSAGCVLLSDIPQGLLRSLEQFIRAAKIAAASDEAVADIIGDAVETTAEFMKSAAVFDRGFAFYAELYGGKLSMASRCLDPSPMLDKMMKSAVSSVLFSATLVPTDYFADVLGCREAKILELDSPYDPKNLCLFTIDSVSTRYADRESFAEDAAEIIATVIEAKEGNYIVYFPSYEYMKTVYDAFSQMGLETDVAVQSRGMTAGERNAFLARFAESEKRGGTLVGFCVLGGAFSEGVDLKGEKLIGTIIIGTGLPKITSRQNILMEYFDKTRENGREYAYTYPAMIKVLQAAGRVIRSETDRGVVVLVDDRYADPSVYRLFPRSWRHMKITSDPFTMAECLEKFWDGN